MYNKTSAAAAVALAGALLVAACGSFGSGSAAEVAATDGGPHEASVTDEGGALDGPAPDAASDHDAAGPELEPVVGVGCGSATCAVGEGCCLTSASPACTTGGACPGFFVTCAKPSDCGSAGACCFDGARAFCASDCGAAVRPICLTSGDCKQGQCTPVACGGDAAAPESPFRLCTSSTPVAVVRAGLSCALP